MMCENGSKLKHLNKILQKSRYVEIIFFFAVVLVVMYTFNLTIRETGVQVFGRTISGIIWGGQPLLMMG